MFLVTLKAHSYKYSQVIGDIQRSMLRSLVLTAAKSKMIQNFVNENPMGKNIASRFVAGEDLSSALQSAKELNEHGVMATLDHLGENTGSIEESEATAQGYIAILNAIAEHHLNANISIKLTALGLDISEDACLKNVRTVLDTAQAQGNFVRLDMEGSAYTERTLRLTHMLHAEYSESIGQVGGNVGTVIQSMLYRSSDDIDRLIEDGIRVRLVKGAYQEPSAIAFPAKSDVDENYRQIMYKLLKKGIYPAFGTHDVRLIADAKRFAKENGIAPSQFEFQMLYGIRRDLQNQLQGEGYNVRIYIPYGSQWYPYLTRRMAERPANLFFIMSNFARG